MSFFGPPQSSYGSVWRCWSFAFVRILMVKQCGAAQWTVNSAQCTVLILMVEQCGAAQCTVMVAMSDHRIPPTSDIASISFHNLAYLVQGGFYRTQVSLVRSMGPVVSKSLCMRPFADLTDVTLVYEDTKSILTDNANRAIQGKQAMHVT